MRSAFAIIAICLAGLLPAAQAQDCPHFDRLMQAADGYWKKGEFEQALNQLAAAREHCPGRSAEVDRKSLAFTREIARKYEEAEREKRRADVAAAAAQRAARRAYANDMAYKSQTALRDGDRTTAYRLAEFAHRYVDDENLQVTRAFVEALYYNDNPTHSPLPWAYNLEGHTDGVISVSYSPDGKRLATGSRDNTAKIWDLESGKAIVTLEGHTDEVISVSYSPDGKRLATGSRDNTAKIWDLESGKAIVTLKGHRSFVNSVSYSPDGKWLATGSWDGTAKIWDLESGKAIVRLEGHTYGVSSVSYSPDGKRLATGSSDFSGSDNTAKIWDLESGKALVTLEGHSGGVSSVSYSPDGKRLAMASGKMAKIWDLESGKAILTLEGHTYGVSSVSYSPDGKRLATGSWDGTAKIWDLESGKAIVTLEGHTSSVISVSYSPDGKWLATGSWDGTAKIWDLESGKALLTLEGHTYSVKSVCYSPDGKQLATGSVDRTAKIWDLESGKALLTLEGHRGIVSSVCYSPDGKRLATGSLDGTAKIWDLESGKAILTLEGHSGYVSSLSYSPDGKRLATGSGDIFRSDGTAKIWDLESGKAIVTLEGHTSSVESVSYSPDGKYLATGSYDNTAKIWDLESGKAIVTLEGHTDGVISVSYSPDGKRLATGSGDNTAKIWDLESGKAIVTLEGHTSSVESVSYSPDGKRLVTASGKMAKIWALVPEVWQDSGGRAEWLAGLAMPQLSAYGLESLLDQRPNNENSLIATRNVWQIAAFAQLYDQNTRNSQDLRRTAPHYARAVRLFQAAMDAGQDSVFLDPLGKLYARWAGDILESARPDTAMRYIERACQMSADKSVCPDLWQRFSDKTGKPFDFNRFLASEDAEELRGYGDYFYYNDLWEEAEQLYKKAEGKEHSAEVLERLFEISEETGDVFDFNRFLASEDTRELRDYGDYFYYNELWEEAKKLYEKAEGKEHSAEVLERLFEISEETGDVFDFNRFLASEDTGELRDYGDYFYDNERWEEAKQLYEKVEGKEHSAAVLFLLFSISEKTGELFDFKRFLALEDAAELRDYGAYFYKNKRWEEAKQLYEKAEGMEHSAEVLMRLFAISEKTGESFDFKRFLASEEVEELESYIWFFYSRSDEDSEINARILDQQNVLRLREKQMQLDANAVLTRAVANDYNRLGYSQLFLPNGTEAEKSFRRAIELDFDFKYPHANLPHAILLQGRFEDAKAYYLNWAAKPFGEMGLDTYRDAFLFVWSALEEAGVPGIDYAEVRGWLEE